MARPRKCRKVCALPYCAEFGPHSQPDADVVEMELDEYEVIRLIDFEGMTQEECAQNMEVARTTVQAIYASARKKIASCIVLGSRLSIGGGDIEICEHHAHSCTTGCCRRKSENS